MASEELPDVLFRATGPSGRVAHVDGNCDGLVRANGVRALPAEYLRRAEARLCDLCADGRRLE